MTLSYSSRLGGGPDEYTDLLDESVIDLGEMHRLSALNSDANRVHDCDL